MRNRDQDAIPALTARQMAEVDRAMFSVCGLDVLQVMEVAGRAVAVWVRAALFEGDVFGREIAVLCGSGGNGGDGYVAARYLRNWGADVTLIASSPPTGGSPAEHQWQVLQRLDMHLSTDAHLDGAQSDLIVDAMLGFSSVGPPRGRAASLIESANRHPAPVIAIDLPSGLDATTGDVHAPCIAAYATVTLGLPKTGLMPATARAQCGRLIVADIGIPDRAFLAAGVDPPAFHWTADFVELEQN